MEAVICPVCKGEGKVCVGIEKDGAPALVTCHGCNGKGWVVVPDEKPTWKELVEQVVILA